MEQNKIENNQTNATISASVPEQNVVTIGVAGSASGENMMAAGGKKKSNGMLYGMILCAVLAIGGIGFGVWAMVDGSQQRGVLDKQIGDLKKQNSELSEQLSSAMEESNSKKTCSGTYYGELKEEQGGATFDLKYTYVLNEDGTFTADYGGVSSKSGVFMINDNTISLTGNREIGGPRDVIPSYVTEDAVIADDCSFIKLELNGSYRLELKKQ